MVLIAGTQVPVASVAMLALRLYRLGELELSSRIGFAVDMDRAELSLSARERKQLLRVLEDDPENLHELRAALSRY